jgi:6-phosphogluconate dehydrogenase
MDNILKAEDDIIIYDILNHILEILKEKLTCILSNNECPPELKTPLNSILYATTHHEIKELKDFREIIKQKYGTEFVNKADNNEEHFVNEVLVEKFKKNIYSEQLIKTRLKQICIEKKIDYEFLDITVPEFLEQNSSQLKKSSSIFSSLNSNLVIGTLF